MSPYSKANNNIIIHAVILRIRFRCSNTDTIVCILGSRVVILVNTYFKFDYNLKSL